MVPYENKDIVVDVNMVESPRDDPLGLHHLFSHFTVILSSELGHLNQVGLVSLCAKF